MNLSHAYGVAPSPEDAERLLLRAVEEGVTLFDTAALYGFGANEELVGRVLARHRDRIVPADKCGMTGVDGRRVIDGRPETLRRTVDEALARLRTDVIDLYYLHRLDRAVQMEESATIRATWRCGASWRGSPTMPASPCPDWPWPGSSHVVPTSCPFREPGRCRTCGRTCPSSTSTYPARPSTRPDGC